MNTTSSDDSGYLLCLFDQTTKEPRAWMLLRTVDFEPLGAMATTLAALARAAKGLAETAGCRLDERSAGGQDVQALRELTSCRGHVAGLREYTFADGEADSDRLCRHFRLLLRDKPVTRAVSAIGALARLDESFFGRETARRDLVEAIDAKPVMLLGSRRSGKTSLLYSLVDDPPEGVAPVYLDMERLLDPPGLAVELAAAFVRQPLLAPRIEDAGILSDDLPEPTGETERLWRGALHHAVKDDWAAFIGRLLAACRDDPVPLLLLDEYGDFLHALQGGPDLGDFVDLTRDCLATGPHRLIVTGSRSLEHLVRTLGVDAAFAGFCRFVLPAFEPEAARVLFGELLRARGWRPTREAVDKGVELVGHQVPYFLQMLADDVPPAGPPADLTDPGVVERAYRETMLGYPGQTYFDYLEQRLKANDQYHRRRVGQQLLRLVAERGEVLVDELVLRFAETAGGRDALDDLLMFLEEYFFLERAGEKWRFSTPVLRDYVRRYYGPVPL